MKQALAVFVVVLMFLLGTIAFSRRFPRSLRGLVYLAFVEYMICASLQLVYSRVIVGGGDEWFYVRSAEFMSKLLENSFSWAFPEAIKLFFQQDNLFKEAVEGSGSNTGSMTAAAGLLMWVFQGSDFGAHFFVAGLAFFGALVSYRAIVAGYPEGPPKQLFWAVVLFPSIAFWTAALHKESFSLFGMGFALTAWNRMSMRKWVSAFFYAVPGLGFILLFRAPVVPPLALGIAVHFILDRLKKTRKGDAVLLGPVYFAGGLAVLALGMLLVTRISPQFGVDRLGETVGIMQNGWAKTADKGGSDLIHVDDLKGQLGLGQQLAQIPLGLANALFRPQIWDVHNVPSAVGAAESLGILYFVVRAIRRRGARGTFNAMQAQPFLVMAAVITIVGCLFVGLVTLNIGTLARYRVPFLPFYGSLVVGLAYGRSPQAVSPKQAVVVLPPRRRRSYRAFGPPQRSR